MYCQASIITKHKISDQFLVLISSLVHYSSADLHPLTQRGLSVILGRHNLYPIAAIRANCAHSQEAQGKLN